MSSKEKRKYFTIKIKRLHKKSIMVLKDILSKIE